MRNSVRAYLYLPFTYGQILISPKAVFDQMKILVTGAAGQLGSYLVEALAVDHQVTGLDIKDTRWPAKGAEQAKGDIGDYRLAMKLCRGMDAVVHTAAQVSVDRSVSMAQPDGFPNIR